MTKKRPLTDYFCCPSCRGGLVEKRGSFCCTKCNLKYPVLGNVPILLSDFKAEDFDKTRKSFSKEWGMFKQGDKTWTWNLRERENLFLKELQIKSLSELKQSLILDAGCGNGQLTSLLSNYCEIIGMDLSQSVFGAEKRKISITKKPENLKFIEGNIMNPPLKRNSFDIIYSSGVLHHTPDTYKSFVSLIPLLKKNGRYYVYLYRKDRKDETISTYLVYRSREITRNLPLPLVNLIATFLAPFAKAYADFTTLLGIRISSKRTIREHKLSLYDHFAPKYAYRHTIQEVEGWFKKYGFNTKITFEDRNGFGILGAR